MAGSRKGEHRGGAKKGHISMKPKVAPAPPSPHKPRRSPKRNEEYYREITAVIRGEDMNSIEPREVMLEAMRYFYGCAVDERNLKLQMIQALARCETDDQFKAVSEMLEGSEARIREMYQLAGDMGFKVAPYVHSKLSSIEISGPDKGPIEIINILLTDIHNANKGRPTWAPADLELEAERAEP